MKISITSKIPNRGIEMLRAKGYEVIETSLDRALTPEELIQIGVGADAILSRLNDRIDGSVMDAWGKGIKVIANYAVGFDNIDVTAAHERNIFVTNTPDVLTETVAEFTFALMLSIAHRIPEADVFSKAGKYTGWAPEFMLGGDVAGKILGIIGLGRIGSRVAHYAVKGFGMRVLYYDIQRNEDFERGYGAEFCATPEDVLKEADFVSLHVPLLDSTRHLINADRLRMMKRTAYVINTSRGPVVDEIALRDALKEGIIRGAAIDVWEHEPELTPGLSEMSNIIVTPHIASATEETRQKMSEVAARNIIEALEGRTPPNIIK